MQENHIRVNKEAEHSYSFAFGDELRKSLIAPWKIPILPISLTHRMISHRKNRISSDALPFLKNCIFVYDLEKMRRGDQKSFTNQSLNGSNDNIGIGIGTSMIEADFKHHIPTRKEMNVEPKEWNILLEEFLLGLIRAYRPQKLVFVGKYPYAGLMSVIRKCQTDKGFYWIHVRGDEDVVEQRSEKFAKAESLSFFTGQDTIIRNTVFFDSEVSPKIAMKLKNNGINIISSSEHAEYLNLEKSGYDYRGLLMKNQTIFISPDAQKSLGHVPNYLLPNLVICNSQEREETVSTVIKFRKKMLNKKTPMMTVEAKLDLWLQ